VSKFTIKHARPLFRRELRDAPAHPLGERVLVWEYPPETVTEGGLAIAETAQKRYMAGLLIAAGDQAADKLYDLGAELGDEVWFAQYAGLIESWQHIVGEDAASCAHDSVWEHVPAGDERWAPWGGPNENRSLRACRNCGTLKLTERVLVMSVDDICVDVDLQARLERGELVRRRGQADGGRTRFYLEPPERPTSFEMKGAT
jgi:co-chaperonin GroES (HSP10)